MVDDEFGFTTPFSTAEVAPTEVASLVNAVGAPVVNVSVLPEKSLMDAKVIDVACRKEFDYSIVEYAQGMNRRLGDRLAMLTTHNEPWVIAILGHELGVFAPGLKSRKTAMLVSHHLLLSHGMAVRAIREAGIKAN